MQEPLWSADSRRIYFVAEDQAEQPIYVIDLPNGAPHPVAPASYNAEISVSGDGRTLAFRRSNVTAPAEIFAAAADGAHARQLTHHNAALLSGLEMNPPEPFWFEGAEGTRVEGFLIKPPHFDASKKYPLLLLVHGGPQGADYPLPFAVPEAAAIVSTGTMDAAVDLPAMQRVVGNPTIRVRPEVGGVPLAVGGSLNLDNRYELFGDANAVGWQRTGCREW